MGELSLTLAQRMRLTKMYVDWAKAKRIDVMPTTLLGWLNINGYLNTEAITEALENEKEELGDE